MRTRAAITPPTTLASVFVVTVLALVGMLGYLVLWTTSADATSVAGSQQVVRGLQRVMQLVRTPPDACAAAPSTPKPRSAFVLRNAGPVEQPPPGGGVRYSEHDVSAELADMHRVFLPSPSPLPTSVYDDPAVDDADDSGDDRADAQQQQQQQQLPHRDSRARPPHPQRTDADAARRADFLYSCVSRARTFRQRTILHTPPRLVEMDRATLRAHAFHLYRNTRHLRHVSPMTLVNYSGPWIENRHVCVCAPACR